jgi:hypothetical protein
VRSGGTGIAAALDAAYAEIAGNAYQGRRRVIDLSGDGRANTGERPAAARDRALALGITVNGLAIRTRDRRLDRYYRQHVIGGPGAFVMSVGGYDSFAVAMRVSGRSGPPFSSRPCRRRLSAARFRRRRSASSRAADRRAACLDGR